MIVKSASNWEKTNFSFRDEHATIQPAQEKTRLRLSQSHFNCWDNKPKINLDSLKLFVLLMEMFSHLLQKKQCGCYASIKISN
jgi:hypothetical protein